MKRTPINILKGFFFWVEMDTLIQRICTESEGTTQQSRSSFENKCSGGSPTTVSRLRDKGTDTKTTRSQKIDSGTNAGPEKDPHTHAASQVLKKIQRPLNGERTIFSNK